ncbi:MAG: hypothetical protein AB7O62_26515 [Pirellulales bacterium]
MHSPSDKPIRKAKKKAANRTTKEGLKGRRAGPPDRQEVREQTKHQIGHPK